VIWGEVGVALGDADGAMTGEALDGGQVDAAHDQVATKWMAQAVEWSARGVDVGSVNDAGKCAG